MTSRTTATFALAAFGMLAFGCATTQSGGVVPEPESFEAAQLLARSNEARPDTLEWRRRSVANLGQALSVTDPCMRGIAFEDIPTVNAVVKLSIQGRVVQAFALEDTTYARCFSEHLKLMNLGSAPWDGYWYEISMLGPSDAARIPSQIISFSGEACVPIGEATQITDRSLEISEASPASGGTIGQGERVSILLAYSVPLASADQYKLMAIFETTTPGRAVGMGRVDFPYPATCGTKGRIKAIISADQFLNMPDLPNPVRFNLALVSASDMSVVAQSRMVEYTKR